MYNFPRQLESEQMSLGRLIRWAMALCLLVLCATAFSPSLAAGDISTRPAGTHCKAIFIESTSWTTSERSQYFSSF